MHLKYHSKSQSRQSGSTLVISMIILILIMMMGITAMMSSDTQFKLSGNLQFEDTAMNNAETAITAAEALLASSGYCASGGFTTYSSAKPEQYPSTASLTPLTMTWGDTNSMQVIADSQKFDSQRYLIQLISKNVSLNTSGLGTGGRSSAPPNLVNTYLITARGTSARGSIKFIQSYYKVRLPC